MFLVTGHPVRRCKIGFKRNANLAQSSHSKQSTRGCRNEKPKYEATTGETCDVKYVEALRGVGGHPPNVNFDMKERRK
jgi:hypothetical protein